MPGKALAKKQPDLGQKPDFLTGLARCQGCNRSLRWVNVWWVTIKLPKVVASGG